MNECGTLRLEDGEFTLRLGIGKSSVTHSRHAHSRCKPQARESTRATAQHTARGAAQLQSSSSPSKSPSESLLDDLPLAPLAPLLLLRFVPAPRGFDADAAPAEERGFASAGVISTSLLLSEGEARGEEAGEDFAVAEERPTTLRLTPSESLRRT